MTVVPESFQLSFGCQFIAYFLDSVLYGAAMILVVQYLRSFNDGWKMRALVVTLATLATVHVTLFTALVYDQYVLHFGDFPGLDIMPRTAVTQLLAIYLTAFTSQIYFATRIWFVSRHNVWLTAPILLLALLQISAGIAQTTLVSILARFSLLASTERVTTIQSGATAACDVCITAALCFTLQRSRTGFKATDGMLNNLIIFTVNRGAITSLAALMNMVWFVSRPGTFIFMIPLEPSCELYVISVLATLLARKSFRKECEQTTEPQTMPMSITSKMGDAENAGGHTSSSVFEWEADKPAHPSVGLSFDKPKVLVS